LLLAVGLAVCLITPPGVAQAPSDAEPGAEAVLASTEATQLTRLAESGRFADLLARLRADFEHVEPDSQTGQLIAELERFDQNRAAYLQQRRQTIQTKLEEARKALEKQQLEEALVALIEAHGLAEEPQTIFARPVVVDTVAQARAAAAESAKKHNWVESSGIYRLLDLLYEDEGSYKDELRQVAQHIRVLGLYAPEVLEALYEARAERLAAVAAQADAENDDADVDADADADEADDVADPLEERPQVEHEHWSKRLEGVDQPMLEQALLWSARKHVDRDGYTPMMLGAVEGLITLLETQGLDETFPGLADAEKVRTFRQHLDRTAAQLKNPEQKIDRLEAEALIDRILAVNDATVELPETVLIYEMGEGAMARLDDFTSIIWPEDLETFSRSTQGAFFGVGIQISRRDGRLVVVSPLENTPAQRAGIKAGDIIATVDGAKTDAWSLNRAVAEITGPEGSEVVLGIERGAQTLEVTLERAKIEIESIRGWEHRPLAEGGGWDFWIDQDAGIGYVRLSQFIPQTADDLDAAIARMQQERDIRGLILDLRFNPGGLLDASIDIADRFIDEGPIVSTVDGLGNKTHTERARRFRTYEDFPLIVLVNEGSASASEIVAGALQDYGRAMIIGSRSFGKGSVQDLFGLSKHQARLKLTRQYYMLPLGRIIHRKDGAKQWGIEPDLTVRMTTEQVADALELRQDADILRDDRAPAAEGQEAPATADDILIEGVDPQLEAALLILKTRQLADRLVAVDDDGAQALLEGK
jgi:carboxyl-terminal processing protease